MLISNMILEKCHLYIFVVFCLYVTKSKQISKIIVATCSQGLYTLPGPKYSYSNNFNSYIQALRGIITFVAASLWMFV